MTPLADVGPAAIAELVAQGLATTDASELALVAPADARQALLAVTHDLRSPLNAMMVLLDALRSGRSGPLTPQQAQQLLLLAQATQGMAALTNDAFDLARGHPTGAAAPLDLADVLGAVRRLAQPVAETRRLTLRLSAPPLGVRWGQAATLQRILLNLVTNALKYTESGLVTVGVTGRVGDPIVHFGVRDTGPGLSAREIAALREGRLSEQRLDGSRSAVGLALCQSLLEGLGTTLHYEPNTPGGAHFHFLLALPTSG